MKTSSSPLIPPEQSHDPPAERRICCVIDNNSWEVGITEIDLRAPSAIAISQIPDSRSFEMTLERLAMIAPHEILVAESHVRRPLFGKLQERFREANIVLVARSSFNETRGGELLRELSNVPLNSEDTTAKYLARAAFSALVTYVEKTTGTRFERGALLIKSDTLTDFQGRLFMDASTRKALELIANRRTGEKANSLLAVLDRTVTPMGSRMLRAQLICPPAEETTVRERLDAVEEAVDARWREGEEARRVMRGIADTDSIASRFALRPTRPTEWRTSSSLLTTTVRELRGEIESIIALRDFGASLGSLQACLIPMRSKMWVELRGALERDRAEALSKLMRVIDERVTHSQFQKMGGTSLLLEEEGEGVEGEEAEEDEGPKRPPRSMRHIQDIFCIRAERDGLLDVARLAFITTINAMETLVEQYREEVGGSFHLRHTAARGYHLACSRALESRLPARFIQAVRQKKQIFCTTPELASLNNRQAALEQEILRLSFAQLAPVRLAIRESLPNLFRLSDTVGTIDLILTFAAVARANNGTWVKPVVSEAANEDAPFVVVRGRHPVVESIISASSFVPTDVRLPPGNRLTVVTGPNCAGKSTFLCEMGVLVVLSHLGSFVPAERCEIPLVSRICTRLHTDDALEENASTFSMEMQECAYLLNAVSRVSSSSSPSSSSRDEEAAVSVRPTPPTNEEQQRPRPPRERKTVLILIDELGRGTSTTDGLSLAWGVCNYLIRRSRARVFFSTHFSQIKRMKILDPNRVECLKFVVSPVPAKKASSPTNDEENVDDAQHVTSETIETIRPTHRLVVDPVAETDLDDDLKDDYGIRLARLAGMPGEVVDLASRFRRILLENYETSSMRSSLFLATTTTTTAGGRRGQSSSSSGDARPADEIAEVLSRIERACFREEEMSYDLTEARKLLCELGGLLGGR